MEKPVFNEADNRRLVRFETTVTLLEPITLAKILHKYIVSIFCFLGNVISGVVLGFSAILLPQLEKQRNEPLTETEASLIGNSPT